MPAGYVFEHDRYEALGVGHGDRERGDFELKPKNHGQHHPPSRRTRRASVD